MDARCGLHSDLRIPPGEFLGEVLESMGMSVDELAGRLGRPPADVRRILEGKATITEALAGELERIVGVPAHIWMGLEDEYRR
jgi:HTH-type transcriptional regulator/antitoxin HigA